MRCECKIVRSRKPSDKSCALDRWHQCVPTNKPHALCPRTQSQIRCTLWEGNLHYKPRYTLLEECISLLLTIDFEFPALLVVANPDPASTCPKTLQFSSLHLSLRQVQLALLVGYFHTLLGIHHPLFSFLHLRWILILTLVQLYSLLSDLYFVQE